MLLYKEKKVWRTKDLIDVFIREKNIYYFKINDTLLEISLIRKGETGGMVGKYF